MKIGIVAEGPDDIQIIKYVVKCLTGIDTSDMVPVRPKIVQDETDNEADRFSNWELVLNEATNHVLIDQFFEQWEETKPALVIHIDTAERDNPNYNITEPQRKNITNYKDYSIELRKQVKKKIEDMLPIQYRKSVAYAIAIEETEAWIIPLFENRSNDTSSIVKPKEHLSWLISLQKKKIKTKFTDTRKKRLNAEELGKCIGKAKGLDKCKAMNMSLELFCKEIESLLDISANS